ncbi:uncharacterized protein TM35_000044350 [Trypanosoma theileri]|uniref:Uncharacterized protein n=1 Tax=Trypanosoma theileri TaxID=67003 RepID=A0A1X0P5W1_9TRYP|nr:uncharacterized protein TM35_000044350 [Trypanosoma theileri]ORC92221.1 hypothetical protein TM35_000044350 [Trypanosoma theileri]
MHRNTLPGTLFVALAVLLLGLLLSSSLAPIARRECDDGNIFIFGFLLEYEKSVNTSEGNNSTSLQTHPLPYKIAENVKNNKIRFSVSDFPNGALRTCMILYIILTCLCGLFALVSITAVVMDTTMHLVKWNSFQYRRLLVVLCLTLVFVGRFIIVVIMATRGQLYAEIENGCFVHSGQVYLHSGFSVSLVSLCICILADVALWNTGFR